MKTTLFLLFTLPCVMTLAAQTTVLPLGSGIYSVLEADGSSATVQVLPLGAGLYSLSTAGSSRTVQIIPLGGNRYSVTDSGIVGTWQFVPARPVAPIPLQVRPPQQPDNFGYTLVFAAAMDCIHNGGYWYSTSLLGSSRCHAVSKSEFKAEQKQLKQERKSH